MLAVMPSKPKAPKRQSPPAPDLESKRRNITVRLPEALARKLDRWCLDKKEAGDKQLSTINGAIESAVRTLLGE